MTGITISSSTPVPTNWTVVGVPWEPLPVLATPMAHGQALYCAIQERIYGVCGDDAPSILPPALLPILQPFNPHQDYKKMEWLMHDAILWLLPNFFDAKTQGDPYWTVPTALAALGLTKLETPNPVYLSAKWLWQSYGFINLMEHRIRLISISFIDEAQPVYVGTDFAAQPAWFTDKQSFIEKVSQQTAVFAVSPGNIVPTGETPPSNCAFFSIGRDGKDSGEPIINAFNYLYNRIYSPADNRIMLGMFIDGSGSMGRNTIEKGLGEFYAWLAVAHPKVDVQERIAGDERWLYWTQQLLGEIAPYKYLADVRVDDE